MNGGSRMRLVSVRVAVAIVGGLLFASRALATPIAAGTTVVPSSIGNPSGVTVVFDSGLIPFSFGAPGLVAGVEFDEFVVDDPFPTHLYSCGASCLDFALVVEPLFGPPGATTTLTSATLGAFGGDSSTTMDADYITGGFAPTSASRGPGGGSVAFQFVPGGAIGTMSAGLVLRTDLTTWNGVFGAGFTMHEVFPEHDPFDVRGVDLVSTPEPTSLVLMGSGALIGVLRRRRAAESDAIANIV